MTTCLKPCILFSAFALLLEIVLIVWLGDIVKDSENYDFLVVGTQLGSVLFGLLCFGFHCAMLKANGYFTFGNNNSYLLIILMTFILFSCFCCAFMASNVWASEKLLNLASFLVLDALQAVFVGLSLFVQKASYDEFILKAMKLNTKQGNPIDLRTASRLYRLKHGRNHKMFNDSELDRLRTYSIPENEDINQLDDAELTYTTKNPTRRFDA